MCINHLLVESSLDFKDRFRKTAGSIVIVSALSTALLFLIESSYLDSESRYFFKGHDSIYNVDEFMA